MNKLKSIYRFSLRKIKSFLRFAMYFVFSIFSNWVNRTYLFVIFCALVFYFFIYRYNYSDNWFTDRFDAWATVITASLAIIIWFNESYSIWKSRLPKKLTCHFKYINEYVLTCFMADLAHEGDIRNYSTQIASQMCGSHIHYFPYFDIKSEIEKDIETKLNEKKSFFFIFKILNKGFPFLFENYILHYTATFYLKSKPVDESIYDNDNIEIEKFKSVFFNIEKVQNKIINGNYLVWYENSSRTENNKYVYFENRPNWPCTIDEAKAEETSKNTNEKIEKSISVES